jgi:hypothetical protein
VEELELVLRKLIRSLRVVFKVGVENVCDWTHKCGVNTLAG